MADPTLDEINAELARRGVNADSSLLSNIVSGGKALLGGAESGAVNTLGFLPEGIALPGNIGRVALQNKAPISPTEEARKALKIPEEPKTGIEQALYRFSEGAAPAMAMASPSFLAGPVVGAVATGTAGLVGGLGNVAAKGLFPENPYMQMLVGFAPGLFNAAASKLRFNVPETGKPSVSAETNIPMTAGQRTGNESLLRAEADISKTSAGTPVFKDMINKQLNTAQSYAEKIQKFTTASDLSPQEISGGVINAVDRQNASLVNQFRAANKVNFNAAKKVAGDTKIFGSDGVNSALDNQIAYYGSDQMPPDLRAIVAKLEDVKNRMSIAEEPSMILNAEGKPATVTPEQTAKLTIDELQKNLESWGKAAKTGEFAMPGSTDNVFKGTTPGTVKGIARAVLNGFRSDLDAAIKDNVPGARELKIARDSFKEGLNILDQAAEIPIIKEFAKDWETSKDASKAVARLQNMSPSERTVVVSLLEKNKPEIISSLRNRAMQSILDSSKDSADLLNNLKEVVKLRSEKGTINLKEFMFPTKEEQMKAMSLISDLEKITQKPAGASEGFQAALQGTMRESAAATGGWTLAKSVAAVQDILNLSAGSAESSTKLAWMMTNPDGQKMLKYLAQQKSTNKPLPQTYADTLNFLSKYTAAGVVPNANRPVDLSVPSAGPTLDEINAELERRKNPILGQ